ncbi:MAG: hypothetical protein ACLTDV_12660 [Eubacterium sp.]
MQNMQWLVIGSASRNDQRCCRHELREEGKKVGLLKLRVFRPFPGRRNCRSTERLQSSSNYGSLRELSTQTEDRFGAEIMAGDVS